MKKDLLPPFLLISLIALSALALPKAPAQERIKEFVQVVNVEVIVRVSDQGRPVSGLQKNDFRLSENGRALKINGFNEFRRAMAAAPAAIADAPDAASIHRDPEPRLFILYFWLLEPNVEYQPALDYFFKTVYRTHDRVLLVSPQRVYEIGRPQEIIPQRQALAADLDDFTSQVVNYRRKGLAGMQSGMDAARPARSNFAYSQFIGSRNPLDVNTEQFKKFAASLKKLNMEKWVLVFCQRNLALLSSPGFISSEISTPTRFVGKYTSESDLLSRIGGFSSFIFSLATAHKPLVKFKKAEMEKMFIQCGATFHLLVLDSKKKSSGLSDQAQYIELETGWQDVFAAISSATGGMVLKDKEMDAALQTFSQQQDIYYIMTYEPAGQSEKKRRIKLELPGKNYDLFYDNEGVRRQIGTFAISAVDWQEPELKIKLENYLLDLQPQGIVGRVTLTIRAISEMGELWTSVRELELTQSKPEARLKLKFPLLGNYHLVIDAVDNLGSATASAEKTIVWSGSDRPAARPEVEIEKIIGVDKETGGKTGGEEAEKKKDSEQD